MDVQHLSCTLQGPELLQRLREWEQVTSRAKTRVLEENALVAVYPRDRALLDELRRLVEAEKDCCSFLDFRIEERVEDAVVRLEVPEGMHDLLPMMMGLASPPATASGSL